MMGVCWIGDLRCLGFHIRATYDFCRITALTCQPERVADLSRILLYFFLFSSFSFSSFLVRIVLLFLSFYMYMYTYIYICTGVFTLANSRPTTMKSTLFKSLYNVHNSQRGHVYGVSLKALHYFYCEQF